MFGDIPLLPNAKVCVMDRGYFAGGVAVDKKPLATSSGHCLATLIEAPSIRSNSHDIFHSPTLVQQHAAFGCGC